MELRFDARELRVRLAPLDTVHQLAFGASCCTRLLANYSAFLRDTGWGDSEPLQRASALIWSILDGKEFSSETSKELSIACEAVTPHSDDFSSLYVSLAQDACFSTCAVLDFVAHGNLDAIVEAASYAIDSVDLYVQEIEEMDPNSPDLEHQILVHPFMQRELERQNDELRSISQASSHDSDFFQRLRTSALNGGKSNLDLM